MTFLQSFGFRRSAVIVTLATVLGGLAVPFPNAPLVSAIPPPSVGPCRELGTVTAGNSPAECEVAPGETVQFLVVGGDGGAGGIGGSGADGCPASDNSPGGTGGVGGLGGLGGAGAAVQGSYTNTTGSTVTLEVVAGTHGADGLMGSISVAFCLGLAVVAPAAFDGNDGGDGTAGSMGQDGGDSGIYVVVPHNAPVPLVVARGGNGGTGGAGGTGGQGGRVGGAQANNGFNGFDGVDGADGITDPNPPPAGMTSLPSDGNPRVTFAAGAPAVVLPPGVSDLVTQPVGSSTTVVPSTTVPPTTVAPSTTAPAPESLEGVLPDLALVEDELPATGSDTTPLALLALALLSAGVVMVSRRHHRSSRV